jgi:hypothetical protein
MTTEFLVVKSGKHFKSGQIVEGQVKEGNLLVENKTLEKDSFVMLNEVLSPKDEERIRQIVRDMLKKFLYRQYTRSAFLLQ